MANFHNLKKQKRNRNEPKCDECGAPAVWCAQMILKVYPYDPQTGEFGEPIEPVHQDPGADWYCAGCSGEHLGV